VIRVKGGVLFDIDGTLLTGSVLHLAQLGETLSQYLGRDIPIDIEGERPMLAGTDLSGWIDVQIVRTVLEAEGPGRPDEADVAVVMAAFERDYAAAAAERLRSARVVDGAIACLERLSAAGNPLGLVTGNASFVARIKFETLGLDRFFRFHRDLGFGDWRADRPAVAAAAVRALVGEGGDVAGVAYVGDTQRDMQAARAAGVRPIGVLTGTRTVAQLEQAGADVVIGSVADLYPVDERGPSEP